MAGPAPAVAAARQAVRVALADLPPGALVLVACSGGADSLALAAATAFVAPRSGLRAGAVSIDHDLQQASARTAELAAESCRRLGLAPAVVRTVRVPATGAGGPEAAARTARYAELSAAAQEHGADAVLLGHTLDDQAETVVLGLARGSGGRSLAGMAPVTGRWRRPLLGLRREQTEACCRALGLDWATDPTNRPDGPWRRADGGPLRRSAVRHEVLPAMARALGPGVPEALARTADRLREDEDYLAAAAAELGARVGLPLPAPRAGLAPGTIQLSAEGGGGASASGTVDLDAVALAAAHRALRGRVLHRAAVVAGCPPGALATSHVEALDALVADYRGQGPAMLPGGVRARRECGRLIVG
ncbi:tRNA lysidine(34) synthetase TilS [Georgenia sp. MJ173]|uniref:tRNA lysidine(34) synthetase TilS n=1 Tax=Georgenia sunbinii TaxID=3117728 RepID=UPI002F264C10